jgi:hypothetical protein
MLFFNKAIYFIIRLVSWIFLVSLRVRKETDSPGPALEFGFLPDGFRCFETKGQTRTYGFSVGKKVPELAPIAIKRRGLLGRLFFKVIKKAGIKTKQNIYFEIAPMNDFVVNNVLNNKPLIDSLMSLFYGCNRSWFKVKWLFSVKGRLWAETDIRLISFQSHISEDMKKISIKMAEVLKELKKTPKIEPKNWNPLRLMKINGFVNGLCFCAVIECFWIMIFRGTIRGAELISLQSLMVDSLMLSLCVLAFLIGWIWIVAQDFSTRVFALKYNYIKLILSVFASCCFILHDINCDSYRDDSTRYQGTIIGKHVSRSAKGGTSYHAQILLPELGDSVNYRTKSKSTYEKLQKGDAVHVFIHEGALGYQWWNEQIYM